MEAEFLDKTGKKEKLESHDCEWDTTGGVFDVEVSGAQYGTVLLKDAHVYVPPTSPPALSNCTTSIATAKNPYKWASFICGGLALVLGIVLTGVLIYYCCCNNKKDAKKDAETELSSVVTKRNCHCSCRSSRN
uniref:Uncharacterized protein n=1 Tax=Panagrolaimus sp. JU765 TaxID=591449 RepID=A0AC34RMX1_9BILA